VYEFTRRKNNLNKVNFGGINQTNYRKSENYLDAVTSLRSNLARYLNANYHQKMMEIYHVIQTQDKGVSKQQLLRLKETIEAHFGPIYEQYQELIRSFPTVHLAPYRYVPNPTFPGEEMMTKGPLIHGNASTTRIAVESGAHLMESYDRALTSYANVKASIDSMLDWLSPDYQARRNARVKANANQKAKANANQKAKANANKRRTLIKGMRSSFPARNYRKPSTTRKNNRPMMNVIPEANESSM